MSLAFDDAGVGLPLVLLHAFPFDRSLWNAQKVALSARYRVITPDLPAHGDSPPLKASATIDGMADAVLDLIDDLKLTEPIVLGGISMGGYVALSFAARHPERLRGLMLFDTRSAADSVEAATQREISAREIESAGSTEEFVTGMLPRLFAKSTRDHNSDLVASAEKVMRKARSGSVASTLRALASRADRNGDLGGIRVPCLVAVGEEDAISPPGEMKLMADQLAEGRFVVIPSAGHLPPLENPVATVDAIHDFLSGLQKGAGDR